MSHYKNFTPPFEIPDSWEWVRLEDIGDIVTGSTPSKSDISNYGCEYPFYKPNDLEQGFYTTKSHDNLSAKGMSAARELPIGSVLVTCIGATIGKTGLIRTKGASNQQINAIIPNMVIDSEYLYYIIIGEYFQNSIKQRASSTTLPILNKGDFSKLLIPIPPKNEQKRIFSLIIKLFDIVSDIENAASNINESVRIAKSKILDLAMQGKLVPQDPADESAADMLLRINPKAKIITDNPHSWNMPKGWVMTALKELIIKTSSKQYQILQSEIKPKGKIPVISQSSNFIEGYSDNYNTAFHPNNGIVIFGDHTKIVKFFSADFIIGADGVKLIDWGYNKRFLYYLIKNVSEKIPNKGYSRHSQYLFKYIVGLPPLREQMRIVAKIEELYSILDKIEASLQS